MDLEAPACPICLEEFSTDLREIHDSRCGHRAHILCIRNTIRSGSYNCPICRKPFGDVPTPAEVDKTLVRYTKMLKSNIPAPAVRQRMVADEIPIIVIDAFFTGGASTAVIREEDTNEPAAAKIVDFSKYSKMVKVGMAEEAIRQKMEIAGISTDDIDSFFVNFMENL